MSLLVYFSPLSLRLLLALSPSLALTRDRGDKGRVKGIKTEIKRLRLRDK